MVSTHNGEIKTVQTVKGTLAKGEAIPGCELAVLVRRLCSNSQGGSGGAWHINLVPLYDGNGNVVRLDLCFQRAPYTTTVRLAMRDDGTAVVERVWLKTDLPDE